MQDQAEAYSGGGAIGAKPPWTSEISFSGGFHAPIVLSPPWKEKFKPPSGQIPEYAPET